MFKAFTADVFLGEYSFLMIFSYEFTLEKWPVVKTRVSELARRHKN
jgi:hypothetical protein